MSVFLQRSGFIGGGGGQVVPSPIPTDYIAFWTMDSVTGSTLNDQTGNYNGTILGGTQDTSEKKFGAASLAFAGTSASQGVTFASTAFDFGGNSDPSFSVSFWVNSDVATPTVAGDSIFGKWTAGGDRCWLIVIDLSGVLNFILRNVSNTSNITRAQSSAFAANQWDHYCCVYDKGSLSMNIYRNGVLDNGTLSGSVPSSFYSSTTAAPRIGQINSGLPESGLDGNVDQMRVYDRALTATEVADLAAET